jgi:hypothetical protein
MNRKILTAALVAAGALTGLAQAAPAVVAGTQYAPNAYVTNNGYVNVAPPSPVYEPTPAPRQGYVWSPGHYEFRNGQYAWIGGTWLSERPGYEWKEATWVRGTDGQWHMTGGTWVRCDDYAYDDGRRDHRERSRRFGPYGDIDRDGILNKDDRDRDGDGVSNWNDDFPNNPNRS